MRVHAAHQHLYLKCIDKTTADNQAEIFIIQSKILYLQQNNLTFLSNQTPKIIIHWECLIQLDLSSNNITSLPKHHNFWQFFPKLQVLLLHDNKLNSMAKLIESLQFIARQIKVFTIYDNPLCESIAHYQSMLIRLMPNVLLINHHIVTESEILGRYKRGYQQLLNINIDAMEFEFVSYQPDNDKIQHLFMLKNQLKNLQKKRNHCTHAVKIQRLWRSHYSV